MKKHRRKSILLVASSLILILAVASLIAYYLLIYLPYVTAYENELLDCKTLSFSDENGINLVFFSLHDNAEKYSEALFSIPPLNKEKDKFNIYYIDNYSPQCEIYKGVAILCYSREILKKAASCPNDFVVVLEDKPSEIRSSSYQNVMSINSAHPQVVFAHEFAHSFANLAEEYAPAKIPSGSKNCVGECSDFYSETDGCFLECSDTEHFRSIESGIMRTLSSDKFGKFNENLILDILNKKYSESSSVLTGRQISEIKECSKQVYYEIVRDPQTGKTIGTSKQVGCIKKEFVKEFDESLIFTDAPNEQVGGEIVGETFVNKEIPIIIQLPDEQIQQEEDKTIELTIIAKEIVQETPNTELEVKDKKEQLSVDFSNVKEPVIIKKTGFIPQSAEILKDALNYVVSDFSAKKTPETTNFAPESTSDTSKNDTNKSSPIPPNTTSPGENNDTNESFSFLNPSDSKITARITYTFNSPVSRCVVLTILILAIIAIILFRFKKNIFSS